MKRIFSSLPAVLLVLLLAASIASAHHSFAMFDKSIEKVVTGTCRALGVQQPAFLALHQR